MSASETDRARPVGGFLIGYLFEAGALTVTQLDAALERQLHLAGQGRSVRIGEVLLEMGVLTREQLDQAQRREQEDKDRAR
jgi:hypothetical protein